jgi:hypothetical protein
MLLPELLAAAELALRRYREAVVAEASAAFPRRRSEGAVRLGLDDAAKVRLAEATGALAASTPRGPVSKPPPCAGANHACGTAHWSWRPHGPNPSSAPDRAEANVMTLIEAVGLVAAALTTPRLPAAGRPNLAHQVHRRVEPADAGRANRGPRPVADLRLGIGELPVILANGATLLLVSVLLS